MAEESAIPRTALMQGGQRQKLHTLRLRLRKHSRGSGFPRLEPPKEKLAKISASLYYTSADIGFKL